jgi:hypothetical protein
MKTVLVAAAMAAFPLASLVGAQTNLLTNPGFENGLTGWSSFGPNIYAEFTNPPAVAPHSGSYLLKMYGQFIGGTNANGIYQSFPATPGQTFTMDCWVRHHAFDRLAGTGGPNDNYAAMKIAFCDGVGNELASAERRVLDGSYPTDTWIDAAPLAATAPAGTVNVQAFVLFLQPAVGTGAAQYDDITFTLPPPGNPAYPGTGEDLLLASGIGGAAATYGPTNDVKSANAGDLIELNVSSPGGLYNLSPYFMVGQLFPTGSPPTPQVAFPELWFSLQGYFTLVSGISGGPVGSQAIGPNGGSSTYYQAPPGLAGTSVMIQALVISSQANNLLYSASDAHEIRFQ